MIEFTDVEKIKKDAKLKEIQYVKRVLFKISEFDYFKGVFESIIPARNVDGSPRFNKKQTIEMVAKAAVGELHK